MQIMLGRRQTTGQPKVSLIKDDCAKNPLFVCSNTIFASSLIKKLRNSSTRGSHFDALGAHHKSGCPFRLLKAYPAREKDRVPSKAEGLKVSDRAQEARRNGLELVERPENHKKYLHGFISLNFNPAHSTSVPQLIWKSVTRGTIPVKHAEQPSLILPLALFIQRNLIHFRRRANEKHKSSDGPVTKRRPLSQAALPHCRISQNQNKKCAASGIRRGGYAGRNSRFRP